MFVYNQPPVLNVAADMKFPLPDLLTHLNSATAKVVGYKLNVGKFYARIKHTWPLIQFLASSVFPAETS